MDGIWRVNTTAESYTATNTATNLLPNTEHTISTKTVRKDGLITSYHLYLMTLEKFTSSLLMSLPLMSL
ncbi:MAG: hypothetical protein OD815_001190 [Candidatus Alkanophagales archaeon MCA70_species_2]|nr:hypothetical protein [Candidatus Alkanophaga liquidiphilum]